MWIEVKVNEWRNGYEGKSEATIRMRDLAAMAFRRRRMSNVYS